MWKWVIQIEEELRDERHLKSERGNGRGSANDDQRNRQWRRQRRRSWLCLFGNSRPGSPRGMLMRERPFSSEEGGRARVGSSHGYQTSERRGDRQGRGASGVREVNLAGIPQQLMLLWSSSAPLNTRREDVLVMWGTAACFSWANFQLIWR